MDYKIIRLNSNNADITTTDKKHFSFFLRKPIILNDEYVLQVKEFLVDSTYTTSARVVSAPLIQDMFVSNNDFYLQRSTIYKNNWYTAVDIWRQGRIYLQN